MEKTYYVYINNEIDDILTLSSDEFKKYQDENPDAVLEECIEDDFLYLDSDRFFDDEDED